MAAAAAAGPEGRRAAQEAAAAAAPERGGGSCVLCCGDLEATALGRCDHPVCYRCSTKMRVLCEQRYCAVCREELRQVSRAGGQRVGTPGRAACQDSRAGAARRDDGAPGGRKGTLPSWCPAAGLVAPASEREARRGRLSWRWGGSPSLVQLWAVWAREAGGSRGPCGPRACGLSC